jgi:hypothetical protein
MGFMTSDKIPDSTERPRHRVHVVAIVIATVVLVLAVLIIGLVSYFAWAGATAHERLQGPLVPAKTEPLSLADNPGGAATREDSSYFDPAGPITYYKTVDEALANSKILQIGDAKTPKSLSADYLPETSIQRSSEPILRFEDNNALTLYYLDYNTDASLTWEQGGVNLTGYVMDKKDGMYSDVRYILRDPQLWSEQTIGLYFDEYDKVAESICNEAVSCKVYARSSNGSPTYMGFSCDPSVLSLRIGGKAPTKVITTQCQGKTYYVWYYVGTDFRKKLLANPAFSFSESTAQKVEDTLDITLGKG